jgi:hypothetical protein
MLTSLLSMGMPESGREYPYLIFSDGFVLGSTIQEFSLDLLQCILTSQSYNVFRPSIALLTYYLRGHLFYHKLQH